MLVLSLIKLYQNNLIYWHLELGNIIGVIWMILWSLSLKLVNYQKLLFCSYITLLVMIFTSCNDIKLKFALGPNNSISMKPSAVFWRSCVTCSLIMKQWGHLGAAISYYHLYDFGKDVSLSQSISEVIISNTIKCYTLSILVLLFWRWKCRYRWFI